MDCLFHFSYHPTVLHGSTLRTAVIRLAPELGRPPLHDVASPVLSKWASRGIEVRSGNQENLQKKGFYAILGMVFISKKHLPPIR